MLKREGTAAPLGLVLALANKPNCPSEASHVMKTSSEMNYTSVNPLINIMDSSLSPLRSNKLSRRDGDRDISEALEDIKEGKAEAN